MCGGGGQYLVGVSKWGNVKRSNLGCLQTEFCGKGGCSENGAVNGGVVVGGGVLSNLFKIGLGCSTTSNQDIQFLLS